MGRLICQGLPQEASGQSSPVLKIDTERACHGQGFVMEEGFVTAPPSHRWVKSKISIPCNWPPVRQPVYPQQLMKTYK